MKPDVIRVPSKTGLGEIYAEVWPAKESKAVLQIAHGMAEHIGRYADFAEFLAENGYTVIMNDHAGHGKSIQSDRHQGYFGSTDGWKHIVDDMKQLHDYAATQFPGIPVVLMGHSMGSFLSRAYAVQYPLDHAMYILSGTAGRNVLTGFGKLAAKWEIRRRGPMKPSSFLQKMSFGQYNKRVDNPHTANDWLSREEAVVAEYEADPLCGFPFTAEAMLDLFSVMEYVSGRSWAAKVADVPIYIFSGDEDPVGNYGKGITQVRKWLEETGHHHIKVKLYEGGRHEMLNEVNKEEVYRGVLGFLRENL